jgi:hypothetical protein
MGNLLVEIYTEESLELKKGNEVEQRKFDLHLFLNLWIGN